MLSHKSVSNHVKAEVATDCAKHANVKAEVATGKVEVITGKANNDETKPPELVVRSLKKLHNPCIALQKLKLSQLPTNKNIAI